MRSVGVLLIFFLLGVCRADSANRVGDLFSSGDTESARDALADTPIDPADPRARYFAGMLSEHDGKAKVHFRAVMKHSDSDYADDAQFELAESVYADPRGLYVTARRKFRVFVDTFPDSPHRPLALYRMGRTFLITARGGQRQSQVDSARALFGEVLSRFPDSHVAHHAAVALVEADLQMGDAEAATRSRSSLPQVPAWAGEAAIYAKMGGGTDSQNSDAGSFWVQVGAFSNRSLMNTLVTRLRETDLAVRLVESGQVTLVQVGPYATRERAEVTGRHIALVESLTCQVIQD